MHVQNIPARADDLFRTGLRIAFAATVIAMPTLCLAVEPAAAEYEIDEFDGKLSLDWDIRNPDESGFSLKTNPGELTLMTLRGSIWNTNSTPVKNLMLLREPLSTDHDFETILHVSSFEPTGFYHQVGLICYESDEQYLKFTVEHDREKSPETILMVNNEMGNQCRSPGAVPEEIDGPFWLRFRRRRGLYQLDFSNDGEKFWMVADQEWEPSNDDAEVRIGIICKQGPTSRDPVPAVIESFRFRVEP